MKIEDNSINSKKIREINENSNYRVYQTHTRDGKKITVMGRSVPWKGINGDEFKKYISPNGKNIWGNLKKAIAVNISSNVKDNLKKEKE